MTFKSFEEILSFAIEKEKEAVAFYEEASQMERYAGAKKTFEDFAEQEKKHQALLENIGQNREIIDQYEFKWIPDIKRSDYLVDMDYETGMPYTDILRLAMKREEKALKLYRELQKRVEKEEDINLFKLLRQEEANHKLILESLYDDLMAEQGD